MKNKKLNAVIKFVITEVLQGWLNFIMPFKYIFEYMIKYIFERL